jgi:hypothetical protein
MSPDALLYVMTGAVIVAAAALIFQAALLLGLYKSFKEIREQLKVVSGHAETFVRSAEQTLTQSRKQISEVAAKTNEVLALAHKQLVSIDEFLGDASVRARFQMERVEAILDDAVGKLNETAALLNKGVLRPVREINAIAAGVQAALRALFIGRRLTVERATSDEEMFI